MCAHWRILALSAGILLFGEAGAASGATLSCTPATDGSWQQQTAADAQLQVRADAASWLEIDEDGRALDVQGFDTQIVIPSPPRLARRGGWVQPGQIMTLRDSAVPGAAVSYRARLFCASAAERARALSGLLPAARAAVPGGITAAALPQVLAGLDQFAAATDSAELRAYAVHLSAQLQLVAQQSGPAAEGFLQAVKAWQAAGDIARARAAHTAWAEEQLNRARHDSAIGAAADLPAGEQGAAGYYAARLVNIRCLGLVYRGRRDEAAQCYEGLVERLVNLAEPLELANALVNQGFVFRDLDNMGAARQSAIAARQLLSTSEFAYMPPADTAMISGRARLLSADLALRDGAVAEAIGEYDIAVVDFTTAKAPRWQATALLQSAALFGRVGAYGDGYATWTRAIALIDQQQAPARVANALMVLARIQRDDGKPMLAAWMAGFAAQQFSQLGMPSEQQAAAIVQLRSLLESGATDAALRLLQATPQDVPQHRQAWALARAAAALRQNRADQALAELGAGSLLAPLGERTDDALLRASALRMLGDQDAALQLLRDALQSIEAAGQKSSNVLLRHLLRRRSAALRELAQSWLLGNAAGRADIDALVQWLPQRRDSPAPTLGGGARSREAFERALTRELLLGQTGPGATSATLPALLSTTSAATPPPPPVRLAALQRQLAADSALYVLLEAGEHAAALWITQDNAIVTTLPPRRTVQAQALALRRALAHPDTPMADVSQAAQALGNTVLAGGVPAQVRHLLVLSSPLADQIVWSVLPRGQTMLVESLSISTAYLVADGRSPEIRPPATLQIFIAPQSANAATSLQMAGSEPALIRTALPGWPMRALEAAREPVKLPLLRALAESAGWVHIGAHGITDPAYLGRSGLWLDAEAGSDLPRFVSALDLFDQGVGAALVVLNACDLASDAVSGGSLSFADTLMQLGAQNVVAARWPVSDTAAALWIPAFYSSLGQGRSDPAEALRQAQLKLRGSRAFRHPYFWAGLVHLQALPSHSSVEGVPP